MIGNGCQLCEELIKSEGSGCFEHDKPIPLILMRVIPAQTIIYSLKELEGGKE